MAVFLAGVLLAATLPLSVSGATGEAVMRKITVDNADAATLAELRRVGATRLVDYGSFSLWRITDAQRGAFAARASVTENQDFDTIYLRGAAIDTPRGASPVQARLRQIAATGQQFWLVQFVGPVKTEWLDALRADGAEIVQYLPNNAYVVWADGPAIRRIEDSVGKNPARQWTGEYHPAYRLAPELQRLPETANPVAVVVEFYKTPNVDASIAALQVRGGRLLRGREDVLRFAIITLELPAADLAAVASQPDVFNVEPFFPPKPDDERQDQIVAGNVTTTGGVTVPTGPGYLSWLEGKGFPADPAQYPIVSIHDSGVDTGIVDVAHPALRQLGVASNPSRVVFSNNCTDDADARDTDGHGTINAGIAGGYANGTGSAFVDANGFQYGLGISPYTRLGNTKMLGASPTTRCDGGTDIGEIRASLNGGATITSNSWGAGPGATYTTRSRDYDILTRDGSNGAISGGRPMLHVFSAGNGGPGTSTITNPKAAKNILVVGSGENVRPGTFPRPSTNAENLATSSSRGPTTDGRFRPDLIAPGTNITGPASQATGYTGDGVFGYFPTGQTMWVYSSGTSHAAPAVSGAASLLTNYYRRILVLGQTPSPAMLKALLMASGRFMTGAGANDTLPSSSQGYGEMNMRTIFDGGPWLLTDQSTSLAVVGQTFTRLGFVQDGTKPFRVMLAYTDAPGATIGDAYVNNLDLEVTVGGQTYKGNVFSGANSTAGGAADGKNNTEAVFLPAGVTGAFTVTVRAKNLNADAITLGGVTSRQDFALAIGNGDIAVPPVPVLSGLSPASGPTTGGSTVTLRGAALPTSAGVGVTFDGIPAVVTNATATEITVVTPPHNAVGIVNVAVTVNGIPVTSTLLYLYGILNATLPTPRPTGPPISGPNLDPPTRAPAPVLIPTPNPVPQRR